MPPPTAERARPGSDSVVRRALVRFVAAACLALLAVSGATVLVSHSISQDIAIRHAKTRGITFAEVVSAPLVDSRVLRGGEAELQMFSDVMNNRLADTSMVHIKVWDRTGRIIWADVPGLRGRTFRLDPDVYHLPSSGGAIASLSRLDKEDDFIDGPESRLLEVYVSTRAAGGEPILVETYWSTAQIDADARAIMVRLAPLPIGGLLLFAAVLLPLAWSLARRVDRARAESRRSFGHALAASDLERRRIARDLHDGVLQEVGGAGYALALASRALPADAATPRRLIEEVSGALGSVGESLRSLLADIYPPQLARDGLDTAVLDLADRAAGHGVDVRVDIDPADLEGLPLDVVRLSYRVIREALGNVVRHAQASAAVVRVTARDQVVSIVVRDDGRGLGEPSGGTEHLGLRLLEDTLVDVGGTLQVESAAEGGTVFTATLPWQLVVEASLR